MSCHLHRPESSGPNGSGKTQLAIDMLTRLYAGSWERIYVFSPSVHLDSVWNVVKHHVHTVMGIPETEQMLYDDLNLHIDSEAAACWEHSTR